MIRDKYTMLAVETWCTEKLQFVTPTNPISIHLDELLSFTKGNPEGLMIAFKIYQNLIEFLTTLDMPIKPIMVIPLKYSDSRVALLAPNSFEDLCTQYDAKESPSLYLIDWQGCKFAAPCEEYCVPLIFELPIDTIKVYSYYREYRYQLGIDRNWDFSRAIYAEYYPDGLLVQ